MTASKAGVGIQSGAGATHQHQTSISRCHKARVGIATLHYTASAIEAASCASEMPSKSIVDTATEPAGKLQHESHRYSQAVRDKLAHRLGIPVRDVVVRSGFADLVRTFDGVLVTLHRSFAVNPLHVKEIRMDTVVLTDDTVIPIPRRRACSIRTSLRDAIEDMQSPETALIPS